MADELLKPADVATRLGVSRATVYIMLRTGRLVGVVTMEKGTTRPKMMIRESVVAALEAERAEAVSR